MGRVIASKFKGMSWWAKGALVVTVTLLLSVFMQQGWFTPTVSDSATNTYRFAVDTAAVNVGADGSTSTSALTSAAPTNPISKYSLTVSSAYVATGYVAVPASVTSDLAAFYGPVYSGNTVLTAPVARIANRSGSTTQGITFSAKVYDYDPSGAPGNGTLIWTGSATSTNTGTNSLTPSFGTANAYTISHGLRLKIVV